MQTQLLDYEQVKESYSNLSKGMKQVIQLSKQSNEEKLKTLTIVEFDKFFCNFGIFLNQIADYEQTSIGGIKLKGRGDIFSGSLIMEFKIYNLLKTETEYQKALKQVKEKYLAPIDKRIAKNFTAILFDGETTVFIKYNEKQEKWIATKKQFNDFVLHDWVLLISKTIKIPISSKALKQSFSIQTQLAERFISILYKKLSKNVKSNQRVKMLFDEWDKSFSYIYGGILSEKKIKEDFEEIANLITEAKIRNIEVDKFLFCFYTYYALIVKLYASEISSIYLPIEPDTPINALLRTKKLREALKYIESGKFYKDYADIDNYIEGGFFSWYLDAWDSDIESIVKQVLHELNKFDFHGSVIDEYYSRDIIKNLYQEIIPQKIRHDLGEYYTPNWLIESVIMDVGFNGNIDKKILDAGCGSGGFLVEVINKIKEANKDKSNQDVLSKIINNVVGFDVNPVAVLTARTNYLLAISPLLKDKNNPIQITIPIYLADAIITPTREGQRKLIETDSYLISTVEGVFALPKDFVDFGYLNEGMRIVEECLESDYPAEDFKTLFRKKIELPENDMKVILDFYNRIKELHKQDKNRIWVKIIQNSFAPLLHTEFDYVVGNPPWIKWDFLSKDYKKKLNHLYLDIYKLFSYKGMKAGLGYSHDDISVMFMYVAIDKYLKKGGRLGFVMKQTLYKSLAGKEFRKFKIEKTSQKSIPLKVIKVNDMLELKPFNISAQSETSTIILEKGEETKYPVPYLVWKSTNGLPKENEFLSDILDRIEISQKEAYPHNEKDLTDIWLVIDKGEKKIKFIKGENYYQSRHGLVNDLNSVFFIDILDKQGKIITIQNRTARAKKKLPIIKTKIENDLVYPFLKPRNVKKWGTQGYVYGILPQKKNGEKNESNLRIKQPLTYKYLHGFKTDLLNRSSKWFKTQGIPFYSFFGLGDYSFAPYKIVWCCMSYQPSFSVVSKVNDKNIGSKEVMPDNTIGYFSVNNKAEAHYICAILNSITAKKYFESRSSKSKWGLSINMVDSVPIPKFDKNNHHHKRLAELSEKAHNIKDKEKINKIEQEINELSKGII
jgi:type I restriction-modification system DNA methylase subunit